MTTFQLSRLIEYTDEEIIAEIQRVASLVKSEKITCAEFFKYAKVSRKTLCNRFGSWEKALVSAGLAHRYNPPKYYTDEEMLNELEAVANKIGRTDITRDEFNSLSQISYATIQKRFGSWNTALEKVGLRSPRKLYTDYECFENLLTVWTHYGRPPKYAEMKHPPSVVGPKAYINRWKTWRRTLHAFAEKVNQPNDSMFENQIKNEVHEQSDNIESITEENKREINYRLRYKVLVRDNFRCVLCGASPATTLNCRLHIDHKIPWSQGGKTVIDNLRTLCESCNLGKGDLIIEL